MKKTIRWSAMLFVPVVLCAFMTAEAFANVGDIAPRSIAIYYKNRNISSGSLRVTLVMEDELQLEHRINPENANISTDVSIPPQSFDYNAIDAAGS